MVKITVRLISLIFAPILAGVLGFVYGWVLRDLQLGLSLGLVFGAGALVIELVIVGVLDWRKGRQTGDKPLSTSGRRKLYAAILIAIVAGASIGYLWFIGVLGFVFGPPALPPLEFRTGYASVTFANPYNGSTIDDVDMGIYFFANHTKYLDVKSGDVFFVPEVSYFYTQKQGFWNFSSAVWADGSTPQESFNSTYMIIPMCPIEDVSVSILAIDEVYGSFTSEDIPDGHHELLLSYTILPPSYNECGWGIASFIPPTLVGVNTTYAYNYSIFTTALWIGWNGTIENYRLGDSDFYSQQVFDVGVYNSTYIWWFQYSGLVTIEADFKDITNATLYYGLLDNVTQWTIPF